MKKISLILVLTLVMGVGVVYAQDATSTSSDLPDPGILPGHPLYFVKSIGEGIGGLFTMGQTANINRGVKLAEKRLAEARALADQDKSDLASSAADRYQEELEKVQERVDRARDQEEDLEEGLNNAIETVAEATLKHQSVLADVYERVPEPAKASIQRAMEASGMGHDSAMSALSAESRSDVNERLSEIRQMVFDRLNDLRSQGAPIPQNPALENGIPSGPGQAPGEVPSNPDVDQDDGSMPEDPAPEEAGPPVETPTP